MPYPPSFYSRVSYQRSAGNLDAQAPPISKNTLDTKFSLNLDGEYHTFVTYNPKVPCLLFMSDGRYMEDRMTTT